MQNQRPPTQKPGSWGIKVDSFLFYIMKKDLIIVALKYGQGILKEPRKLIVALLLLVSIALASGQEFDGTDEQKLDLDIYLYNTGKTLVAGYMEDPKGLTFLRTAQYNALYPNQYVPRYSYDNDTRQLYAWTDGLTRKNGENWSLAFTTWGLCSQCHIVFHLPGDLRLGRINSSSGLNYMITASNESLLVDAQAHGVKDPAITIEYQQPLGNEPLQDASAREEGHGSGSQNLLMVAAFIFILTIGSAFAFVVGRRRERLPLGQADRPDLSVVDRQPEVSAPDTSAEPLQAAQMAASQDYASFEADPPTVAAEDDAEDEDDAGPIGMLPAAEGQKKDIAVSSEMKAVMDALTHRERSIIEALIKHGGRTTQAEIRYETGLPRSSLTMVLVSLERRNLITKKEWGRTNVIELSESFFSKKEQS